MRKFLIAPALALTLATAAGAAFASNDDARVDAPRDQWQTTAKIAELFTTRGYDVRQVKVEKGGYEIYAIDKDGKRIEAHVHPVTGEILKQEVDD